MTQIYGSPDLGLFKGGFRDGTRGVFTFGTHNGEGLNFQKTHRKGSLRVTGGNGGGFTSGTLIPIDTSKTYQMLCYAKTRALGSSGNTAGGHIGFACYDKNGSFIDLRNCGSQGDTTLSRALNSGDTHAYLTSNSGWFTGSDVTNQGYYFRNVIFFPATHPDYSIAYKYTRIGYGSPTIYYKSLVQTDQGDYELKFADSSGNDTTFPNIGYSTPAGTPLSRGAAGGTYNYALGAPNYPLNTWTRYATAPFTGETRNSGTPFRFGTKFIKFMILRNYNRRTESPQDHEWALANILFTECYGGKDYRDVFPTTA
tara:strand:- start:240 stop:1175 length:936 start_codon:yes stop_codon:yes gene_type:complete